jgi:hypothetical protein
MLKENLRENGKIDVAKSIKVWPQVVEESNEDELSLPSEKSV